MSINITMSIQPTGDTNCMARCIAALLDMPDSVVINEFSDDYLKGHYESIWDHMHTVTTYLESYDLPSKLLFGGMSALDTKPGYYILSVPSLNRPQSSHAILAHIRKEGDSMYLAVWDPSCLNDDKFHYHNGCDLSPKGKVIDLSQVQHAYWIKEEDLIQHRNAGSIDKGIDLNSLDGLSG